MIFRRGIRAFLPIAAITLLALPAFAADVPDPLPDPDGKPADMTKPVQVYILMGQSNMLGFGNRSLGWDLLPPGSEPPDSPTPWGLAARPQAPRNSAMNQIGSSRSFAVAGVGARHERNPGASFAALSPAPATLSLAAPNIP